MDDVKRIIKASVNHVAYPNCTIKPKNWLKKLRSNVRDLNVKARKLVHWKRLLRSQLLGRCVRSFTDQEATIQLCNLSVANIDTHTCSALSGRLWKKKKKTFLVLSYMYVSPEDTVSRTPVQTVQNTPKITVYCLKIFIQNRV